MELRHLRCFLAVAEELHFARAAERLHIEQSPLSRAIKDLEEELGVLLFARTTRSTRLTHEGHMFLEHVPRVFTALQQARDSVKAAANGFQGQLRIAVSDGMTPPRFSALLARCRQDEPEIEIRLFEVPLATRLRRSAVCAGSPPNRARCADSAARLGSAASPGWSGRSERRLRPWR